MTNGSYKRKLIAAFKKIGIVSPKTEHFGRYCASAILDMEEVDPTIARAIGNWAIDTFGEVYSSKLPLPAMRVLAGGVSKTGFYRNPRITFKGDPEHIELANRFFPWIESAEKQIPDGKNPTARAFLNLLKNLRWVLLQDSAMLMGCYNRNHFIFHNQRDVFDSPLFTDFQQKLLSHIKKHEVVKDETIENILPGVLKKMDKTNDAIKNINETMKKDREETRVDKNKGEDSMNKLETKVDRLLHFVSYVGRYSEDDVVIGETRVQAEDSNVICPTGESETQIVEQNNTIIQSHSQSESESNPLPYKLPESFSDVASILDHWDTYINENELRYDFRWRKSFTRSENRRFSRIKKIVEVVKANILEQGHEAVLPPLEEFYAHKKSLRTLCDTLRGHT